MQGCPTAASSTTKLDVDVALFARSPERALPFVDALPGGLIKAAEGLHFYLVYSLSPRCPRALSIA